MIKFSFFPPSLVCLTAMFTALHADTIFIEGFESPDVSTTSTLQDGATYKKGQLPNNGQWIGSTQGFGSDRRGLINKVFGDFTAPAHNQQGFYFGYTNSGITSSATAISEVLEADVIGSASPATSARQHGRASPVQT